MSSKLANIGNTLFKLVNSSTCSGAPVAAIIVKEGKNCSETDVKTYAEEKLAKFKNRFLPRKI